MEDEAESIASFLDDFADDASSSCSSDGGGGGGGGAHGGPEVRPLKQRHSAPGSFTHPVHPPARDWCSLGTSCLSMGTCSTREEPCARLYLTVRLRP